MTEWRAVPLLCSPSQATHSSRLTPLFSTSRLHRGLADSSPVSPRPPTLVMASVQAHRSSLDFSHSLLPDLPADSLPGPVTFFPERQSEPLFQNIELTPLITHLKSCRHSHCLKNKLQTLAEPIDSDSSCLDPLISPLVTTFRP